VPKAVFFTSHGKKIRDYVATFCPQDIELVFADLDLPDSEKVKLLKDARFCLVHPAFLSDEVLRKSTHIKLIQLFSAGYDGINLPLARQLGIPVANNGGANSTSVAEHAVLLMLAVYRDLVHQAENACTGRWRDLEATTLSCFELAEKRVGILGMGNIGVQLARRLKGFDVTMQYYDKYVTLAADVAGELGLRKVTLEELCKTSDVISIHVPLTSETRSIVGAKELAMMKPTTIIVNTSRGGVIDQMALYQALKERRIAAAGLDVLDPEPFDVKDPIFKLDNVIITPHSAGFVFDSYKRRSINAFQNIQRIIAGQQPLWIARFT
jgi:phosphoglycerate dehydrogenase-like enzyme